MRSSILLSAFATALLSSPALGEEPTDAQVKWTREHAIPIETVEAGNGFVDLQPLKKLIGDARIVSLGESTHGSREIYQMKHRLVEFLATEMGFPIFSIEACMPEGRGKPGSTDLRSSWMARNIGMQSYSISILNPARSRGSLPCAARHTARGSTIKSPKSVGKA